MSSYVQPNMKAYCAEAALTKFSFVKFGAGDDKVLLSGAAERAFGINMSNDIAINGVAEIALNGGGGLVKLAGTIARGQSIASNAAGLGVLATAGQFAPAIAMESGVAGDVISVMLSTHTAI